MHAPTWRTLAWHMLMLLVLGNGTGCATHQAIRHVKGEPYQDRIERVEHAWLGSNEVRVCIVGRLGASSNTSRYTLHFTPLNVGNHAPSTAMETVLLPRSRLSKGWPDDLAPAGYEPMTVTSWAKTNAYLKVTYYGLQSAAFRTPLILSEDVMLRVPLDPQAEQVPRTRCRWYAFRYEVNHHLEAVPLIPVALAADAIVICLAGIAGGHPRSPYYSDPLQSEPENVPSPDFNESMLHNFASQVDVTPSSPPRLSLGDFSRKDANHALADIPRDPRLNPCACRIHGTPIAREKSASVQQP